MSVDRSDLEIRGWLRDRSDAGTRPGTIVASVMAELDRVPQRPARPWERRWGRDLPMTVPAPGYGRAGALALVVLAALLLLVLVALLAASRRPAPTPLGGPWSLPGQRAWSQDGSRLAFVVSDQVPLATLASPVSSAPLTGDPNLVDVIKLYTVAADGTDLRQLAVGGPLGNNWVPAWSADGKHLFFEAGNPHPVGTMDEGGTSLSVVSATGEEAPVDLGNAWEERWSPVDDVFAMITEASELKLMRPDGTLVRAIPVDGPALSPSWSRDGGYLLFNVGDPNGTGSTKPWVAERDGSNPHPIAGCDSDWVTWSPATSNVLCRRTDDTHAFHPDGSPAPEDPSNGLPDGVISPDGFTTLVWQDQAVPGISVVGADRAPIRLTEDSMDRWPEWSQDGRWVAFWGNRPEGSGLFVMPSAGGPARLLGANAVDQSEPVGAWSPHLWRTTAAGDASVAFIKDRGVVMAAAADGTEPVVVGGDAGAPVRGEPLPSDTVADRVVLLDDGPDRSVYRVRAGRDPTFTVENRTDVPWTIDLFDDVGPGERDCVSGRSTERLVAAVGEFPMAGALPPDSSPPTCTVPPHSTMRVTDVGFVPRGALGVVFSRIDPGHDVPSVGRVVMLDFLPGG